MSKTFQLSVRKTRKEPKLVFRDNWSIDAVVKTVSIHHFPDDLPSNNVI